VHLLVYSPSSMVYYEFSGGTTAIAVFNVLNSLPITATRLEAQGTLMLRFHGGRQLLLPGVVEGVDWTWQLDRDDENLFTCDSGEILVNSALLKK